MSQVQLKRFNDFNSAPQQVSEEESPSSELKFQDLIDDLTAVVSKFGTEQFNEGQYNSALKKALDANQ